MKTYVNKYTQIFSPQWFNNFHKHYEWTSKTGHSNDFSQKKDSGKDIVLANNKTVETHSVKCDIKLF